MKLKFCNPTLIALMEDTWDKIPWESRQFITDVIKCLSEL